jgi:hypothetical protein
MEEDGCNTELDGWMDEKNLDVTQNSMHGWMKSTQM